MVIIREELSKLTEQELEKLYQDKKLKYDEKISKNRRIRGMLSSKVDKISQKVHEVQQEIDQLMETYPDIVKSGFDDDETSENNLEELKVNIQQLQNELSDLQLHKIQISNSITKTTSHINMNKQKEKEVEEKLKELVEEAEHYSKSGSSSEQEELTQLYQDELSTKEKIENFIEEIEEIRNKIHHNE